MLLLLKGSSGGVVGVSTGDVVEGSSGGVVGVPTGETIYIYDRHFNKPSSLLYSVSHDICNLTINSLITLRVYIMELHKMADLF